MDGDRAAHAEWDAAGRICRSALDIVTHMQSTANRHAISVHISTLDKRRVRVSKLLGKLLGTGKLLVNGCEPEPRRYLKGGSAHLGQHMLGKAHWPMILLWLAGGGRGDRPRR
jgi:hypothetical protein